MQVSHTAAFGASLSERSDVTARLPYGCIQVKPVGRASGRSKRGQSLGGTVEEAIGSNRISASRVRHGHTDLRKPLPQISFLNRPRLPTRLQNLVGGERTACLHERSSRCKCLLGRQGLLRHRLHPRSAVRQGPPQSVARPGLTSAAYSVPVTITPSHSSSLSALPLPAADPSASRRHAFDHARIDCAPNSCGASMVVCAFGSSEALGGLPLQRASWCSPLGGSRDATPVARRATQPI